MHSQVLRAFFFFLQSCAAGTYVTGEGATACVACPAGRFRRDTDSSSSCLPCSTGTFLSTAGQTTCVSCGEGTFNNVTASTECWKCTRVFFSFFFLSVRSYVVRSASLRLGDSVFFFFLTPSMLSLGDRLFVCLFVVCLFVCLLSANCEAGTYSSTSSSTACSACSEGFFAESGSSSARRVPWANLAAAPARAHAPAAQMAPSIWLQERRAASFAMLGRCVKKKQNRRGGGGGGGGPID